MVSEDVELVLVAADMVSEAVDMVSEAVDSVLVDVELDTEVSDLVLLLTLVSLPAVTMALAEDSELLALVSEDSDTVDTVTPVTVVPPSSTATLDAVSLDFAVNLATVLLMEVLDSERDAITFD
jgi:hypothetical protein